MTNKEFIQAAIEGGTLLVNEGAKSSVTRIDTDSAFTSGTFYIHFFEDESSMISYNTYKVLLNPEAWKAVGKIKGWDNIEMAMYDITQENDRWGYKVSIKPQWMWYMNKMIQELCAGKTLEEYIAGL